MLERVICLLIGYACGLFQTGYLYGRMKGIDIRQYGSGNAGTTNALRTLGTKAGVITFVGDCLKCLVAVWVARLLFVGTYPNEMRLLGLYAAAGTILGHNFPFYLGFRGGKGIACTAGLLASFDLRIGILALCVFILVFVTTHYVSLGSILVYVVFVLGVFILGMTGNMHMDASLLYEMYVVTLLLAVMAVCKHKQNIIRLVHGTENKTYLKKKRV